MKNKKTGKSNKSIAMVLFRSCIIAVAVELLLVTLLAYLLYQGVLGIELVNTLSAVIKAVGAVCAAVICAVSVKSRRIVFCPLASLIYTLVCFFILSVFSGGMNIGMGLVWDCLLNCATGLAVAFIANMKR